MPKTEQNPTKHLKEAKYSFDHVKNAWYCGKKPAAEEDVLIFLIQFAKARNIPNAGEYAADALAKAKTVPELTTRAFMRARMVRNRNRRTAGKYRPVEYGEGGDRTTRSYNVITWDPDSYYAEQKRREVVIEWIDIPDPED